MSVCLCPVYLASNTCDYGKTVVFCLFLKLTGVKYMASEGLTLTLRHKLGGSVEDI